VESAVVESFRSEFPSLRHASYLLKKGEQGWAAAFFVLSDLTHLYSFDSHLSAPTDPDFQWEVDVSHLSQAAFNPSDPSTRPSIFSLPTVGSPSPLRLCAVNACERDAWARAVLPSSLPLSPSSASSSLSLLHPFLSFFSHVDHHGWLSRRKKFSSRWVRHFCVLVDAELYLYPRSEASPKEWSSVCYICTQSGKPFELVRGTGGKVGDRERELTWDIVNPQGNVSLKADGEKELEGWMRAIQDNCRRLSHQAHSRQRKATQ
jgi:hypothetical protein